MTTTMDCFARTLACVCTLFVLTSPLCGHAAKFVRVSSELNIYYEESGKGQPLVLIPGWMSTTEIMKHQFTHFSKHYRTITFDPRSQGRSSRTIEGNNYVQHGADLDAFFKALRLKNAIVIAHSWGCYDTYAYIRLRGHDNLKAFVCIDMSPKGYFESEGDWSGIKAAADLKAFHDGFSYDREKLTGEFLQSMVTRPLTAKEKDWFLRQLAKTPTSAAVQLDYDGNLSDYSAEAKSIDGKIPVLNVLADPGWYDGWNAQGQARLKANAPHSEIVSFGLHLMLWEFPEKFNAAVDAFLEKAK